MIYLVVLLFAFLCHYKLEQERSGKKTKQIFYFIEYIVLVLVAGLRYRVGGDSLSYEDDYMILDGIQELSYYNFATSEHGFLWYAFVSCCQFIHNEWVVLQILHAIIFNYAVFRFVSRYSNMPFLSIVFYLTFNYLYFNTEVLRASLGVAVFLLWGYDALLKKEWIKYLLLTFIASNFHIECVAFLLFPLAYTIGKCKINGGKVLIITVGAILLLSVLKIDTLLYSIGQYSEALMYRANSYGTAVDRNANGIIMKLILMAPVFICLSLCKYIKGDDEISKLNRGLVIIYFVMSILVIYFPVIFSRIINPLRIFYIVMLTNLLGYIKPKKSLYAVLLVVSLFCGFLQYREKEILIKYYPYHSIFEPIKEVRREFLFTN